MHFKLLFWIVLSAVVGLSYQNETNSEISALEISDGAELDAMKKQIIDYNTAIQQKGHLLTDGLKKLLYFVQKNADYYLNNFANSIDSIPLHDNTTAVDTSSMFTPGEFRHGLANNLRNLRMNLHNKTESMIMSVDSGLNSFTSFVNRYTVKVAETIESVKLKYPGMLTEECSKMLMNLKSAFRAVLDSTVNCVTRVMAQGTSAVDLVDDMALEQVNYYVEKMKTTWDCVVKTEGNYAYKFVKCLKFSTLKDAYNLISSFMKSMDENVDSALVKAEQSLTFVNCMHTKVTENYEDEFWQLVQSSTICSANVNSITGKPNPVTIVPQKDMGSIIRDQKSKDDAIRNTIYIPN